MSSRKKPKSSSKKGKKKEGSNKESDDEDENDTDESSNSESQSESKTVSKTTKSDKKKKEKQEKKQTKKKKEKKADGGFDIDSIVASVRGNDSKTTNNTWFDQSAIVQPQATSSDNKISSFALPVSSSSSSSSNLLSSGTSNVQRTEISLADLISCRNEIRENTLLLIAPILESFVHEEVLSKGKNSSDYTMMQAIELRSQKMLTSDEQWRREFFGKYILKRFEKLIWYLDVWLTFEVLIWMVSKWKWLPIDSRFIPTTRLISQKQTLVFTGIRPEFFAVDLVKYIGCRMPTDLHWHPQTWIREIIELCVFSQLCNHVTLPLLASCTDFGRHELDIRTKASIKEFVGINTYMDHRQTWCDALAQSSFTDLLPLIVVGSNSNQQAYWAQLQFQQSKLLGNQMIEAIDTNMRKVLEEYRIQQQVIQQKHVEAQTLIVNKLAEMEWRQAQLQQHVLQQQQQFFSSLLPRIPSSGLISDKSLPIPTIASSGSSGVIISQPAQSAVVSQPPQPSSSSSSSSIYSPPPPSTQPTVSTVAINNNYGDTKATVNPYHAAMNRPISTPTAIISTSFCPVPPGPTPPGPTPISTKTQKPSIQSNMDQKHSPFNNISAPPLTKSISKKEKPLSDKDYMTQLLSSIANGSEQLAKVQRLITELNILPVKELMQIIAEYWMIYPHRFRLLSYRDDHAKERQYWMGTKEQANLSQSLSLQMTQCTTRATPSWWRIGWIESTTIDRALFYNTKYSIQPACIHDEKTSFITNSDFIPGQSINPYDVYYSPSCIIHVTIQQKQVMYELINQDKTRTWIGSFDNVNLDTCLFLLMIPPEFSVTVIDMPET